MYHGAWVVDSRDTRKHLENGAVECGGEHVASVISVDCLLNALFTSGKGRLTPTYLAFFIFTVGLINIPPSGSTSFGIQ